MVLELSALNQTRACIHNTRRCVMHLSLDWNIGQGASEFVYFSCEIIKFKQNIRFSDSLPLG